MKLSKNLSWSVLKEILVNIIDNSGLIKKLAMPELFSQILRTRLFPSISYSIHFPQTVPVKKTLFMVTTKLIAFFNVVPIKLSQSRADVLKMIFLSL